ncbi:MFS transporter [Paenibacillus durus]|uniref:Arabinose ABC transporter permease n=1 Tax=Paenibacillus durus TaxID=44251 RepID=A0A089HNL7_PAEDU|nr:MFS transporter [Paenibacillus durus]AIQ11938.1 arabinose ABC transporter permease [Paenibacillus durus]
MKPYYYVAIIAFGLFSIVNTEFGVIGTFIQITEKYQISASQTGMLVSLFALTIAIFGPFMTLLFSGFNKKRIMASVLALFTVANLLSAIAPNFSLLLIVRILPAFLHPVYFSLAFVAAASFFPSEQKSKATAYVFTGGTVGMVLGVPFTSFIADQFSLEASFLFSAALNLIALIGLLISVPSMPVTAKLSYKKQLGVLAKPQLWLNIATVCLTISAMFAVFSYFAEYLGQITKMSGKLISTMLILFGASGVLGNLQAGRLLSKHVIKTTLLYPVVLAITYLIVFWGGSYFIPMMIIVIVWGFIHTGGFIINQNWLASEASEAPEFANSLFVSFSNLGIAIGTASGGQFLLHMGTHQIIWGGLFFLALAVTLMLAKIKWFGFRAI